MAEMRQMPVAIPTGELADLLAQMAEAVRTGDSLEGSIEYLLPGPDDDPQQLLTEDRALAGDHWHMVQAAVRTGNRNGQGGMVMLGELREVTPGLVRGELDRALSSALPFASRRVEILIRALQTELAVAQEPDPHKPTLMKRLADAEQAAEEPVAVPFPADQVLLDQLKTAKEAGENRYHTPEENDHG